VSNLRPSGKQSAVIYLPSSGHTVVLGTAGTGKTIMAMLRARYLAADSTPGNGPVLLITYNRSLAAYIRHKQGGDFPRVKVETYGKFAGGYLNSRGRMRGYKDVLKPPKHRRTLVMRAVENVAAQYKPSKFFERDALFFVDELAWISGMGILDQDEYLKVDRVGRGTALHDDSRVAMWRILQEYRRLRAEDGWLYDWDDIATAVRTEVASDTRPCTYRHVVIDEGQDLSPEAIRSLVEVVDPSGSVTFFGDYAQQIYGQGISWRSCNLKIKREERFADNYRNTAAIARLAIAMSKMPHFGGVSEDLVEPVAPTVKGTPPTVVSCASMGQEIQVARAQALARSRTGTVAVLARNWDDAKKVAASIADARELRDEKAKWDDAPGTYYGTYHSAKGLEFDAVILPFCGAASLPYPEVVTAHGMTDAITRESRLLYVAVTRARSELIFTHSGDLTPILPTDASLYRVVTP
jgi:DNA helicase IV